MYSNNMADHHLITDLVPVLSRLVMTKQLGDVHLSAVQHAILVGVGLQHKTFEQLAEDLDILATQLLALFNRSVKKLTSVFREILENSIKEDLSSLESGIKDSESALPSLDSELSEAASELEKQQKESSKDVFVNKNLSEYVIKGNDLEWKEALKSGTNSVISVKTGEKRPVEETDEGTSKVKKKKKENKDPKKPKKSKKEKIKSS